MKNASLRSALFMALYYGTNAVYQGYVSKFYQQRGMGGAALSALLVCFPLFSMVSQPLWGAFSDRLRKRSTALALAIGLSLAVLPMLNRARSFPALLLCAAAFSVCYPAIQPLSESIVLQALQRQQRPYGPVRLCGCAAFAAASLLGGRVFKNDYAAVPRASFAGLCCLLAAVFFLPPLPAQRRAPPGGALRRLLRLPHLPALLALYMPLQIALGYYFSYFAVYFTALPGADSRLLGLSYFIATASEIPFLLLGDHLYRRHGAGRLMLGAAACMALRFGLLGVLKSPLPVLGAQLLHGQGFAVISFCMARYVSAAAPPPLRASAQALLAALGGGAARVLGAFLGALPAQPGQMFLWLSACCLGAMLALFSRFRTLPPLNAGG